MPQSTTIDIPPGQNINNWVATQVRSWADSFGIALPDADSGWYTFSHGGFDYCWGDPLTPLVKARAANGQLTITVQMNAM